MALFLPAHPFFDEMDDLSAALAVQLLLEDSEQFSSQLKGKSREGTFSDAELAFELYKADLEEGSQIIADRQMTRSIRDAVWTDGNVVTELLSQERQAGEDREFALRLGGNDVLQENVPQATLQRIASPATVNDDQLAKLSALYVTSPVANGEASGPLNAESEVEATKPVLTGLGGTYCCTACQDYIDVSKVAQAPCGHWYCEDCLRNLFECSMTDESLFPPRCCQEPIPAAAVRIFLTSELADQYEKKRVEFRTVNRTYCSSLRCSAFLEAKHIADDVGTCPNCDTVTCTMCKAAAHKGDCPADTDLQLVLATAVENQWQRCYSCRRLVELDTGCNHITCTCRAEFCYVCGHRWKSCSCAQWDEDRLLSRAEIIAARQPGAAAGQRRERVAAEVRNLRERHNCDHEDWRYVRGSHRCEECRSTLPTYIFECTQCRLQACRRCRMNRF